MTQIPAETPAGATSGTTPPGGEDQRASGWKTKTLVGVGSVADVAAIAQLLTTGSDVGVLVTGLLAVLAGSWGLIQLAGRPLKRRAIIMVLLIAIGSGFTGIAMDRYWVRSATPGTAGTPIGMDGTPIPGGTRHSSGEVVRQAVAVLKDWDDLDVETGRIGALSPEIRDFWYLATFPALRTGGDHPITPVEGRPDLRACTAKLATHTYQEIEINKMRPGDWACAKTSDGNVVAIEIRVPPSDGNDNLTIAYTVWQK